MAQVVDCSTGVWDCSYPDIPTGTETCAAYNGEYASVQGDLALPVLTGIMMLFMAFFIGANDAANAWATSVGSGAAPLRVACLVAGFMNWAGAVLLGYGVSNKLQKGISDLSDPECWACGYCDSEISVYAAAMFGSQTAAATFLSLATFTAMPVSTTHAIIGGVVGSTVAAVGPGCLNWDFDGGLGGIVASWVISPLLAGVIAVIMYIFTRKLIVETASARRNALVGFPIILGSVATYMSYLILVKAEVTEDISKSSRIGISCGVGAFSLFLAALMSRYYIPKQLPSAQPENENIFNRVDDGEEGIQAAPASMVKAYCEGDRAKSLTEVELSAEAGQRFESKLSDEELEMEALRRQLEAIRSRSLDLEKDPHKLEPEDIADLSDPGRKDAIYMFRYLLVFNAALESFAHGANDTANSTTAFSASIDLYQNGLNNCGAPTSSWWIMALAGGFVALGINVLGWRVIETVGKNLTAINYQRGFCIEFGSTLSVVIATILEVPVSTTHCQIGAVVSIGLWVFGSKRVDWSLVVKIILAWVITIPFSGFLAAAVMAIVRIGL
jgi:sodium-dependent phosphate transporter